MFAGSSKLTAQTRFKSLNFLYSITGQYIVSGQHNDQKNLPQEYGGGPTDHVYWTEQVRSITGKYPALYGADFLFHGSSTLRWNITYEAERQWNRGAIISLMWHACPPSQGASCNWDGGLLSSLTTSQWNDLLTNGGNLNRTWKARIDEISVYLQYLEDKGVEVMWRPLHEQNQTAFWWNSGGAERTKALWRLTHDYMTNVKGLSNLIWVWDMQDMYGNFADWNPGASYFDVAALDVYADGYTNLGYYNSLVTQAAGKPVAFGECFRLPSAQVIQNQPRMSFFMNWAYGLLFDYNSPPRQTNSHDYIREVYNNPKVLTLDEMPGWNSNPVPDNLAKLKPVTVSSTETGINVASNAVDGEYGTRWSSQYTDQQWLYVDLGAEYNVNRVKITWEAAYGRDYQIQVSSNATSWTTIRNVSGNSNLINDWTGLNGTGRYVRINGIARGTQWGYSIFELEVYGTQAKSAYAGTIRSIPGRIEAEHYDNGGQGVAYNDLTAGNAFNVFRTDDVDIENCTDAGGGFNIGAVQPGEWLEYTVDVNTATSYNLELRLAAVSSGKRLRVEMDGQNISGSVTVPNTGGWQNWQTVNVMTPVLSAGQKVMRIFMETDGFNVNYVSFSVITSVNHPPVVNITSPSNNSSFAAGANITISANATDSDGSIARVEFFRGTTKIGERSSAPWSVTWSNVSSGTYSLTARATDNKGAVTNSSAVNITVNNTGNVCSSIPVYKENGGYVAGSTVQNTGNRYQCRPWPNSGWCNGAAWAYAPGTGAYWQDAWTLVGSCSSARTASNNDNPIISEGVLSNAPNPFTGVTIITLQINDPGQTSVKVYSKTGILVRTLSEGYLTSGSHDFTFDSANLPADIYIIKCETESGVVTRKVLKMD